NIWLGFGLAALSLFSFSKFVNWHQHIQVLQKHYEVLAKINEQEAAAQEMEYAAFDSGAVFQNAGHPYSVDLDLFGAHSFYQYTCRAQTAIGKEELANMLLRVAPKELLIRRQAAIADLRDRLDWRQHFQAYGAGASDDLRHVAFLEEWLAEQPFVKDDKMLLAAMYLMPLWIALALYLSVYFIPWQLGLCFLLLPAWLLKKTLKQVNEAHERTADAEKMLSVYARLIAHIEQEEFSAPLLKDFHSRFVVDGGQASNAIRRLSYYIRQLNVRYNPFAIILNVVMLWDLRWIRRLEIWKAAWRTQLPRWFDALRKVEALNSLATLWYNNPDWVMPEIVEGSTLVAVSLGHPLIDRHKRVCNDFQTPTKGHIKLVTGSNMAGKSTFLRTVGLNVVMAMCGSAVCATEMKLPPLQIYTSMRTQDDLHESASSFYAELKRLKRIIEAVETKNNVYFLLDEILKGTNSEDRHKGGKALIKQLIESGGAGIIATHDLELGKLEASYGGAIENLCMEVEVNGEDLVFDYRLKKGVSRSFNATLLMRRMGIRV
ncbi:MAG TPA: hypothetical protein ENJ45_05535, partial [Phaeodactylibacter sp.]|nr:hypothetical protein [Phaeodactylibacter sp.]